MSAQQATTIKLGGEHGIGVSITPEGTGVKAWIDDKYPDKQLQKDAGIVLRAYFHRKLDGQIHVQGNTITLTQSDLVALDLEDLAAALSGGEKKACSFDNVVAVCRRLAEKVPTPNALQDAADAILRANGKALPKREKPAAAPVFHGTGELWATASNAGKWLMAHAPAQAVIAALREKGIKPPEAIGLQVTIANAEPSKQADAAIAHIESGPEAIKLTDPQKEALREAIRRVQISPQGAREPGRG